MITPRVHFALATVISPVYLDNVDVVFRSQCVNIVKCEEGSISKSFDVTLAFYDHNTKRVLCVVPFYSFHLGTNLDDVDVFVDV